MLTPVTHCLKIKEGYFPKNSTLEVLQSSLTQQAENQDSLHQPEQPECIERSL
ncbi:MAG: Unknown protein [uncultured Thiotrichaceae bacterium]|uniref:Uncharacterized protein n=1 Tax=uncultured Thiotrichaceae bacterium TaxID=298394 RepID=A0A6S6T5V0_9GAMM|nr:MAG: Unknown protein [uncultured Thiotrichaceae bacterium]